MLRHKTTIHKAKIIKFYGDHDPAMDKEYNDWIQSLPGVVSLTNTKITENSMQRVIEFTDEAAYKNWLSSRKAQQSWIVRSEYESRYGIIATSTKELIIKTEHGDQVAIPR
jgi:hypothetical protein